MIYRVQRIAFDAWETSIYSTKGGWETWVRSKVFDCPDKAIRWGTCEVDNALSKRGFWNKCRAVRKMYICGAINKGEYGMRLVDLFVLHYGRFPRVMTQ